MSEGRVSSAKVRSPLTGTSMRRLEDDALVRGAGCYTADHQLEGCLSLAILRAPVATGRIVSIDCDEARAMPGVVAVFTGADVAGLRGPSPNTGFGDMTVDIDAEPFWVLTQTRIRAAGEPVAAVVARSAREAQDAVDTVFCDIEEDESDTQSDPALALHVRTGDAKSVFVDAAHVVEVDIVHPRLAAVSLEPRACVAEPDDKGGLHVRLSTQTPHRARRDLAAALGLSQDDLRVTASDVGGAFGMKASIYPEDLLTAFAAHTLGAPVRWVATRGEDFLAGAHGRGAKSRARLAVAADGTFLALEADITCPLGAWPVYSAAIPAWNASRILPGPYRVEAVDVRARAVQSNHAPVGIYRGAGRPEAAMIMERLADAAARRTGLDPLDIRKRNAIKIDSGNAPDNGDYAGLLSRLERRADYGRLRAECAARCKAGELVGIGLALFVEPCGQGWESARLRLCDDGTISAEVGATTQGHGRQTAYCQLLADELGMDPSAISFVSGDTARTPAGIGALASRSTPIGASALVEAARELVAMAQTGNADTLPDWSQVARDAQAPLCSEAIYHAPQEAWGSGVYLAVTSIDCDTGVVRVERMICIDDAGMVINPMLVHGQVHGGIAQGLGEALLERIVYDDDAQLLTGSLMDYCPPRADDMPALDLDMMNTTSKANVIGARGIGEAGTIGAPAAIVNSVIDALRPYGILNLDMPLTPERIWRAIAEARGQRELE